MSELSGGIRFRSCQFRNQSGRTGCLASQLNSSDAWQSSIFAVDAHHPPNSWVFECDVCEGEIRKTGAGFSRLNNLATEWTKLIVN